MDFKAILEAFFQKKSFLIIIYLYIKDKYY